MHYRLLVTFNPDEVPVESPADARPYALGYLSDNGFFDQEGRFSGGWGDWGQVGGRWSGCLQPVYEPFMDKVRERYGAGENKEFVMEQALRENAADIQTLWEEMGGKDINPFARDGSLDDGYPDDAAVVTEELYDRLLKEYEGETEVKELFVDADYDACSREFIGKKIVVVIDYHN